MCGKRSFVFGLLIAIVVFTSTSKGDRMYMRWEIRNTIE